jgi:hypothetical protein
MSVTSDRLSIETDRILQTYLQGGTVPDEYIIERQLRSTFADYYDETSNSYTINVPLWSPINLNYREGSDFNKWNTTLQSASDDFKILYWELLADEKLLTDRLYNYTTNAKLIQTKLAKLTERIQNLMLLTNDTAGFLYCFSDYFQDTSKINTAATSANVNVTNHTVSLTKNTGTTSVPLNLLYLQNTTSDVSFSVINNVTSSTPLSTALITDIFNNNTTAWQRDITLADKGPLVAQLTVRVSTADPIAINEVELQTKMINYSNQLIMQTFYSQDGTTFEEVGSSPNPQYIGQNASIIFPTVYATHFRFVITKQIPDYGNTYNIGFQSINFITTEYISNFSGQVLLSDDISFPDSSRPIGRIACEVCDNIPTNTSINYYIVLSGNEIPITPTNYEVAKYSKIVNLGALGFETKLFNNNSALVSGDSTDLTYTDTIIQTASVYRNIGPNFNTYPNYNFGFSIPASGETYFTTYVNIANESGTTIDFGSQTAILDGAKVNENTFLSYGDHKIMTSRPDLHQQVIASGVDMYCQYEPSYVSPFEFDNNYSDGNYNVFTFHNNEFEIKENIAQSIVPDIDYNQTFIYNSNTSNYMSVSISAINTMEITESGNVNGGKSIYFDLYNSIWVNEVQITFTPNVSASINIYSSLDNINWTLASEQIAIPTSSTQVLGAIIFDKPVQTRYIKISFTQGSGIDLSTATYKVFPPLFQVQGQLITKTFYLPNASQWTNIASPIGSSQQYTIVDAFNNNEISGLISDLSTVKLPYIYLKINNSTLAFPRVDGLSLNTIPLTETSQVQYNYHGNGLEANAYNSIKFKAILSSTDSTTTPQLTGYRVKLS